jgi:EpsI family protein
MIGAAPALVLAIGALGHGAVQPNRSLPLAAPLSEFPDRLAEFESARSQPLGADELRVLRTDDYVNREYRNESGRPFRLSIAYFGRQLSGVSVHSPRNCLPGSGWSPIDHQRSSVETPYGDGSVNRYVVEHESGARAVVYYWYQGRGRVEANEYMVKWDLVRDAVLRRRTDEALVRLVFPVGRDEGVTALRASRVVREVMLALAAHLPA